MQIETEGHGDVVVLTLAGELDAATSGSLVDAARAARAGGARALVVDMALVTYVGSAGLVALHSAGLIVAGAEPPAGEAGWDALHQFGSDMSGHRFREALKIAGATPMLDRLLGRTGLTSLFELHPDRASAVAAAG